MKIDKKEICRDYRHAKYKSEQVQILSELYAIDRGKVIDILIQGGEKVRIPVPGAKSRCVVNEMTDEQYIKALFKRLDVLDGKIRPLEREYREIIKVLESYGTKKTKYRRKDSEDIYKWTGNRHKRIYGEIRESGKDAESSRAYRSQSGKSKCTAPKRNNPCRVYENVTCHA